MATQNAVQGTTELINKLRGFGVQGERIANASINAVADLIVADAKRNAPADLGTIRQNIGKSVKSNENGVQAYVFSAAPESAFQEFGTGGRVVVPAEMAELASQFKGKSSGDFKAFVKALTGWLSRHGIDEKAAYPVARAILLRGLKPQPFLYPAYIAHKDKLLPMLTTAYQNLVRNG